MVEKALKAKDAVQQAAASARTALGTPLQYVVVHDGPVCQEPLPQSSLIGSVAQGTVVFGYPGSVAWICLDPEANPGTASGWMPVRHWAEDRRLILHAVWPELSLRKSFVDALEVSWRGLQEPPLPFRLLYSVEWRRAADGHAAGHTLSSQASATIRGLPAGAQVQLRVGARLSPVRSPVAAATAGAEVTLSGPWQDFQTDCEIKTESQVSSSKAELMSLRAAGALPKRFLRAVRGGVWGLEYRVNEMNDSGVFTPEAIEAGTPVEVCPLLEVDSACHQRSPVLQRLTLPLPDRSDDHAVVLGFARLYSTSKEPNLHWGYLGPDEVLLWAADDIPPREELLVDFKVPPKPAEAAVSRRLLQT
uniref:SET domain-containing protein n=1 Tax=Pyrodinium bahamense TaxID=73915 RepID=A0A7S0FVC9_9DINO|mmetsp:Transcript_52159/g.144403  ORF Transcript_52159/g.144403 Transcript_52159/m.144403 type:complete len:362 (+) Transcript_52159:162-1247(+)